MNKINLSDKKHFCQDVVANISVRKWIPFTSSSLVNRDRFVYIFPVHGASAIANHWSSNYYLLLYAYTLQPEPSRRLHRVGVPRNFEFYEPYNITLGTISDSFEFKP